MKHWWQLAAVAAAGLAIGLAVGALFLGGGPRFAMVDMDRILKESVVAKDYQSKLDVQAKDRDAQLAKLPNTQEKAVKAQQFRQELTALQQDYTAKVLKQADKAVAAVAKRRRIGVVFARGSVRFAPVDLTEEVLTELGK